MSAHFRVLALAATAAISGCAYVGDPVAVQKAERAALDKSQVPNPEVYYDLSEYPELIAYARNLSDNYLALSAKAARGQDMAALGIVAAAATTAGALLFGDGDDVLKGAGLAAGTIVAGENYLKPGEASSALLVASEQVHCIVRAAHTITGAPAPDATERFGLFTNVYRGVMKNRNATQFTPAQLSLIRKAANAPATRIDIIRNGIQSARISLRKALSRELPTYSTLIDDMKNAIIEREQTKDESEEAEEGAKNLTGVETFDGRSFARREIVTSATEEANAIDELRIEVSQCVVSS